MRPERPVKTAKKGAGEAKPAGTAKRKAKPRVDAELSAALLDDADRALVEDALDRGIKPRKDAKLPVTRPAPLFSIIHRWLDEPVPILRLEVIRILASLAILGFMSSRLAFTDEWLTSAGFQVPKLPGDDFRQPIYLSPLSSSGAAAVAVVMVASGLAVAAGFRARISAVIFALTLIYVALADRLAAFTVSKLSPAVMLALAASPIGTRFGVDAWLKKRKDPEKPLPSRATAGGVRFFQLLMPVIYCASGIAKVRGDWLKHPLVLWTHVHDSYQTGVSWALAAALPAWAWTLLQAVVLVFEVAAPLWFVWSRTRIVGLVIGLGMHVMIGLMFWPVRWFALLMIAMLLGAFLPDAPLERLERRFRAIF